nr:restriction endonuclease subunit S [uncultured Rhodopila sp.]
MTALMAVGDVCELVTDGTHYTPKPVDGGVPFLTVKDMRLNGLDLKNSSRISDADFEAARRANCAPRKGDVLFSKDGTVGKVHVVAEEQSFAVLSSIAILRPKPGHLSGEFLAHALRSPEVLDKAFQRRTGSALKRIILKDLQDIRVPVPSFSEQRRIACILDEADALRAKRQATLTQVDALTVSLFYDSFVTPQHVAAWPQVAIGTVATAMRTGPFGSQLLHSEFVDAGIAVLGIDNAVKNVFAWDDRRYITERKYKQLTRYRVYPGDVIVTIMGTCGRAAIVPSDIPVAITTKHLCSITPDPRQCLPEYLHACFLTHPSVLRQLGVTARGAVMPGLNMGLIKDTIIPLPPLLVQQEFADRMKTVRTLRTSIETAMNQLHSLFASLQHRAFRGEL